MKKLYGDKLLNEVLKTSCICSDLDINKEIPLFLGASEEFIQKVLELEVILDLNERSKEAIKFITENNLKTSFNYSIINEMLHNPYEYPLSDWRNLYLIERSIPPRNSKYSWLQRIKIFNNTNLIETGVINSGIAPNGNKFYWRKGTENDGGDVFVASRKHGADFPSGKRRSFEKDGQKGDCSFRSIRSGLRTQPP